MSNAYGYATPKLVCLTCRQSKIRCEPSPHAPSVACARCTRKGLMCQYVPADAPAPTQTYSSSSSHSRSHSNAYNYEQPELPYTGPPPSNLRPRYSGGAYPNLSLSGQGQSQGHGQGQAAPGGYPQASSSGSHAQYPNTAYNPPSSTGSGYPAAGYPYGQYKG